MVTTQQVLDAYERVLLHRVIQASGTETQAEFQRRLDAISVFNTLELQYLAQVTPQ